ncbi:tRNA pseudouridine(13) synthase TruD [Vreelandella gomseomensis]|uniref:tRNA pseudouridine synthase D n=1 Tax=Vreelandella gomseomensis TaxID=370766 RepID=A0ABU1G7N8_9GAMM|nr:tRNA pseudouridine(13) synthase TruD [Halomonas gomseomensis]MDR5873502.1 tRNA pseudouridine(13) synthase TruD [Halomonas gomseomensis]
MLELPHWQRGLDADLGPPRPGHFRLTPDDFLVDEALDFAPEGHGEHLWLNIEKRNLTTLEVVKLLSQRCGVSPRDVGYSGMKDRIAVTRQWLSVHLPGKEAPEGLMRGLAEGGVKVLAHARHPRKLKRGVHRFNRFQLRLGGEAVAADDFETRWQALCQAGVPNYVGPQRFGPSGRNLQRAEALLARGWRKRDDRHGILLSTARSFLFNELLSDRVKQNQWHQPLDGDTLMLEGTHSVFSVDQVDDTLRARAAALDLHPTGPLWGVGRTSQQAAGEFEAALHSRYPALCEGLLHSGVKRSQRALRMCLSEPSLTRDAQGVVLSFGLPRGSFATAVVSELLTTADSGGERVGADAIH